MACLAKARPSMGRCGSPPGGVAILSETTDPPSASSPDDNSAGVGRDDIQPREELFKAAARLLFGADWQREAARALGRDETALARFLLGERTRENADRLYADMLALMRQRAAEIARAADRFAKALTPTDDAPDSSSDQGM